MYNYKTLQTLNGSVLDVLLVITKGSLIKKIKDRIPFTKNKTLL